MNIPTYQTIAGQKYLEGSLGKADRRLRIANTTVDECREYALFLEGLGYVKHSEKCISAGSEYAYNVNLFYCYQNGETCIFVFWDASIHTVFVTAEPMQALPSVERPTLSSGDTLAPTITQVSLKMGGMSYVVRLCDGSFVCIDGGRCCAEDVDALYALLCALSAGKKPDVALWLFTHPHDDHITLAAAFLEKYREKVDVRAFAYQFADHGKTPLTMEDASPILNDIDRLEKAIGAYENATVYTLHTGQSYYLKGVEIEVLWSLDNTYPSQYFSLNNTCSALRFKFDNGKTVIFPADCMHEECRQIMHTYGDYLKSDILQVTHHGLIGGDKGLYQQIDPEICLWSSKEERFLGRNSKSRYQWCLGEGGCDYNAYLRDDSIRQRRHFPMGKTITIEIR